MCYSMLRYGEKSSHTLAEGYRVVGAQFGVTPEWLTGLDPPSPFTGEPSSLRSIPAPLLLLPLAVSAFDVKAAPPSMVPHRVVKTAFFAPITTAPKQWSNVIARMPSVAIVRSPPPSSEESSMEPVGSHGGPLRACTRTGSGTRKLT